MCQKFAGEVANIADPDKTALIEQSYLGLHCLPMYFCLDIKRTDGRCASVQSDLFELLQAEKGLKSACQQH